MRDFARSFYLSTAWRRVRDYIFRRDMGLCVRCGAPGKIVHHKKHLTPENINDPSITLAEDNLELLCMECHAIEHDGTAPTAAGLTFDSEGNLVERKKRYEAI
jgi:5-methylcytosine-specific restriction endonuclease McrA